MSNQLEQPSDSHTFNLAEVDSAIAKTLFAGHLHHLATTQPIRRTWGLAVQAYFFLRQQHLHALPAHSTHLRSQPRV